MKKVLVLGGGKVGKSVGEMLLALGRGDYQVTLADREKSNLAEAEANFKRLQSLVPHKVEYATKQIDATDRNAVRELLRGHDYLVCMLPFDLVAGIAEMANELGVHYFDVTEDVETSDKVKAIADQGRARVALVPQCGLAPGYIAIAAYEIGRQFSEIHELTLRVGALPQYPTNALYYNVTWSVAGVVNEYCEPCNVMLDGKFAKLPALEGLENFSFEGVGYEAFYTSGGVGSLIDTLIGENRTVGETRIAYKTIRYPGHRDLMKFLLQDLRLGVEHAKPNANGRVFDRRLAMDLLDHSIARTLQDVVIVFINCIGMKDGFRQQVNFRRSLRAVSMFGRIWPAIEYTTAAGVCAMVELHRLGHIPQTGFIKQENCSLTEFNKTIFGLAYEAPEKIEQAVLGGKS
ncbi:MAG: saccharopine dehydrogenase family protein [Leptolyngbya sp. PLA3]|nr:MAG: saccharopine dehydrogenase family protein [Cyanobacteria bacterium CYA]MCE7968530.1 saccharopine dehydrogenase family protein [Leptolyngbya sp. PL-A3]